jgi:Glyoxalase-like domain
MLDHGPHPPSAVDTVAPVVSWVSAFLDLPAGSIERATAFWSALTGYAVSPARGVDGEFATLMPPIGDDYLRVQRLGEGPGRIHLDLHVADLAGATADAVDRGAVELARPEGVGGYVVLRSPGGFVFCLVPGAAGAVPPPATWPGVRRSRVYQVCLDLPGEVYDADLAFWVGMFGNSPEPSARRPEFSWLRSPGPDEALAVLVQRLDRPGGPVSAHLDLGSTDRAAETVRHVALGASVLTVEEFWTVLADPASTAYCITDRDPATGALV